MFIMEGKMKKLINLLNSLVVITLVFALLMCSFIKSEAMENDSRVYEEGTHYYSSHDVSNNIEIYNSAVEARGMYFYYQNSEYLPCSVAYAIYPHLEGAQQLTMNCVVETEIQYRALLGFKRTRTEIAEVTYNDLYGNDYIIGEFEGPNRDAEEVRTLYTYSDAAMGLCTWEIIGD